jgi:two-component system sensor histidine kinase PilS (NtrC family)
MSGADSGRPTRPADESWFGALGVDGELPLPGDSRHAPDWHSMSSAQDEAGFLSRQARRIVHSGQTAFERIYGTFLGARAALAVALLATLGLTSAMGGRWSPAVVTLGLVYAVLTVATWLLPRLRQAPAPQAMARLRSPQWLATVGTDIVVFTALHTLAPASAFNYVALLALPALMAGVLTPRLMALATAAVMSMALLVSAWVSVLAGDGEVTQVMTQAGLAGMGLFVITILAGELAGRLAREELTARGTLEMARQQAQLNRLVIEEMQDGVMVVDPSGRVRAANPAARTLLAATGVSRPAPFQLRAVDAWAPLASTVDRAFAAGLWPEAGRDVTLRFDDEEVTRTLRVRIRFTRRQAEAASESFCVLLLEDVRSMEARSRQEKLAAMGRMSAGIAHEIRNPLAAISQANALLAEDAITPQQAQLTRMVSDNVERLKRIVDDVMAVAPGAGEEAGVIDICTEVALICSEWLRANGLPLGDQSALRVALPGGALGVTFDAEHLRRVLVNLLDNGLRHSSQQPGALQLYLQAAGADQVVLGVASDGEPISPDVERHLFEPFFSTRSRGTGLGLYICRELCERHGASIDYRQRGADHACRNEFRLGMRRRLLTRTDDARLPLPTPT